MEKFLSKSIAKKAQIISILLLCTLCSIVFFILFHQLIIAKHGGSILSLFPSENDHQASNPREIIEQLKWFDEKACKNKVYFGEHEGQKVFCLDEPVAPKTNNCIIYSFGIHDNWSFEEKMEELQGCHVSLLQIELLKYC